MKQQQYSKPERFSIFGVGIDNLTMAQSVDRIVNASPAQGTRVGYFVNTNSLNQAFRNTTLRKHINTADFVFADGSGVRMAARQQGIAVRENVNGTDMLPLLCKAASDKGLSVYFFGAAPLIADKAARKMQESFPGLRVAGCHHGFVDKHSTPNVIEDINASGADILLVGMGTPIQETWINDNKHLLNTRIALAVGGLFDFYSGRIPRAPLFMRKAGIEWVWRLIQEPKNKFRRYVIGNPLFLYRIAVNSRGA